MGKTDCGISLGGATITDLIFAEEVLIFAEALVVPLDALSSLNKESEPLGLKVFWIKIAIQIFIVFFS